VGAHSTPPDVLAGFNVRGEGKREGKRGKGQGGRRKR